MFATPEPPFICQDENIFFLQACDYETMLSLKIVTAGAVKGAVNHVAQNKLIQALLTMAKYIFSRLVNTVECSHFKP
jgi:hypothetical protein